MTIDRIYFIIEKKGINDTYWIPVDKNDKYNTFDMAVVAIHQLETEYRVIKVTKSVIAVAEG